MPAGSQRPMNFVPWRYLPLPLQRSANRKRHASRWPHVRAPAVMPLAAVGCRCEVVAFLTRGKPQGSNLPVADALMWMGGAYLLRRGIKFIGHIRPPACTADAASKTKSYSAAFIGTLGGQLHAAHTAALPVRPRTGQVYVNVCAGSLWRGARALTCFAERNGNAIKIPCSDIGRGGDTISEVATKPPPVQVYMNVIFCPKGRPTIHGRWWAKNATLCKDLGA
jgi:hypothetical protein